MCDLQVSRGTQWVWMGEHRLAVNHLHFKWIRVEFHAQCRYWLNIDLACISGDSCWDNSFGCRVKLDYTSIVISARCKRSSASHKVECIDWTQNHRIGRRGRSNLYTRKAWLTQIILLWCRNYGWCQVGLTYVDYLNVYSRLYFWYCMSCYCLAYDLQGMVSHSCSRAHLHWYGWISVSCAWYSWINRNARRNRAHSWSREGEQVWHKTQRLYEDVSCSRILVNLVDEILAYGRDVPLYFAGVLP